MILFAVFIIVSLEVCLPRKHLYLEVYSVKQPDERWLFLSVIELGRGNSLLPPYVCPHAAVRWGPDTCWWDGYWG